MKAACCAPYLGGSSGWHIWPCWTLAAWAGPWWPWSTPQGLWQTGSCPYMWQLRLAHRSVMGHAMWGCHLTLVVSHSGCGGNFQEDLVQVLIRRQMHLLWLPPDLLSSPLVSQLLLLLPFSTLLFPEPLHLSGTNWPIPPFRVSLGSYVASFLTPALLRVSQWESQN